MILASASAARRAVLAGAGLRFAVRPAAIDETAVKHAARADAAGGLYELGGPRVWSFRELLGYILKETGRHRPMLDVPMGLARLQAWFLPNPVICCWPAAAEAGRLWEFKRGRASDRLRSITAAVTLSAESLLAPASLTLVSSLGRIHFHGATTKTQAQ